MKKPENCKKKSEMTISALIHELHSVCFHMKIDKYISVPINLCFSKILPNRGKK